MKLNTICHKIAMKELGEPGTIIEYMGKRSDMFGRMLLEKGLE